MTSGCGRPRPSAHVKEKVRSCCYAMASLICQAEGLLICIRLRRRSKVFRVSGFEPDPTSIVSLPAYLRAFRQTAFLRQAVLRVTGVAMTCHSPSTPISPLMCAYLSRCVDEAFGTSSLKRRFVGLKIVRLPIPALTRGTVLALQCIRPSQLLRRRWVGQSLYTTLNGGQL